MQDSAIYDVAKLFLMFLLVFLIYLSYHLFFEKKLSQLAQVICDKLDKESWKFDYYTKKIYNEKYVLKKILVHNPYEVNNFVLNFCTNIPNECYRLNELLNNYEIKIISKKFDKLIKKIQLEEKQKEKIVKQQIANKLVSQLQPTEVSGFSLGEAAQEFYQAIINGEQKTFNNKLFNCWYSNKSYLVYIEDMSFSISTKVQTHDYKNEMKEWEKLFLIHIVKMQKCDSGQEV